MGLDPGDAADAAELEGIVRQLRGIGVSNKTVPPAPHTRCIVP
jgi:hypothetical protein